MAKTRMTQHRLKPEALSRDTPASWVPFRTTRDLPVANDCAGLGRALEAVETGRKIPTRGYNIFAVGEPGSGKTSALERILRERAAAEPVPDDICYVYNFDTPDRPLPLMLPPGTGRQLGKELERMYTELERMIPRVLSQGAFGHIRSSITADSKRQLDALISELSAKAEQLELTLEESDGLMRVSPLYRGRPLEEAEMENLPARTRQRFEDRMMAFQEHMDIFAYSRRLLEIDHEQRMVAAETRTVAPLVAELFAGLLKTFKKLPPPVRQWLDQLQQHCADNYRNFVTVEEVGEATNGQPELISDAEPASDTDARAQFHVNVLVDRTNETGAPVVLERVPAPSNLCGLFAYRETAGALSTDHTMIRSGALHQANGGYLLLQATDLLSHENAWNSLKRSLRHKEIRIEEGMGQSERPRLAGALKPGVVPLNVKVILVGSHDIYYLLKTEDDNFYRLFKILADFETSMPRTRENVLRIAQFAGTACREEGYLSLHRSGVVRLVEFAARRAGHKERLITRRAEILDLLAEANVIAKAAGAKAIRKEDVEQALADQHFRHGAIRAAVSREIDAGTIMIRTQGEEVGQINGIALYDVAGTVFGTPVRITCRTYVGRRGVVNIDREVELSGALHDKGSLIMIGYLGGRYARQVPLEFSASITFEQSYDEIDGDSASSAELYALLSALSGVPIRQGIAVTGSVNQLGEVQPIGGVNEKIEGVFDVCQRRGLTGKEGVLIPVPNVKNLMLRRDVVEAVKAGQFNIWAVSTIDEGIEVLTGCKAGKRRANGTWEKDSINDRVQQQLERYVQSMRSFIHA